MSGQPTAPQRSARPVPCRVTSAPQPLAPYPAARSSLLHIWQDKRGTLVLKEVGIVHALRRGADDDRTLASLQFQTGDFLDCAVLA